MARIKSRPLLLKLLSGDICHFSTVEGNLFYTGEGEHIMYYKCHETIPNQVQDRIENGSTADCTVVNYIEMMEHLDQKLNEILKKF